jgi:hypothetical protein
MNLTKLKDFFITLREVVIIALFLMLLLIPTFIKNRLIAAGFTKIDMGIAEC